MELLVNSIFSSTTDHSGPLSSFRILAFTKTKNDEPLAIVISLSSTKRLGKPTTMSIQAIEQQYESGELVLCDKNDSLARKYTPIKPTTKKAKNKQKARYKAIRPLISDPTFVVRYATHGRIPDVCKRSGEIGKSKQNLYYWITDYYRFGQTKTAVAPRSGLCGGKGKRKKLGDKKIGAPRPTLLGGVQLDPGINVSDTVKERIKGIIETDYAVENGPSLQTCYETLLGRHYPDELDAAIYSSTRIPTISVNQFWYWAHELCDWNMVIRNRMSKSDFESNARPLVGAVSDYALAPGNYFETDSTTIPVHAVAECNRYDIIGKPYCYFVVDVHTRLIAGVHICLEPESWVQSAQGMSNAFLPKAEFCRRFYVDITEDMWPCQHLPRAMICDRKENLSHAAEDTLSNLGIRLEYPPARRPDRKPVVERLWGITSDQLWHLLPGTTFSRPKKRGEQDPRLDACLTVSEITQLTIEMLLFRNQYKVIADLCTEEMIERGLTPTPQNAWLLGLKNHTHSLRSEDHNQVRAELLRPTTASITAKGVECEGLLYDCGHKDAMAWYESARREGQINVEARADDSWSSVIYIRNPDGDDLVDCPIKSSQHLYADKPLAEVHYIKDYLKQVEDRPEEMAAKIRLNRKIFDVAAAAKEQKQNFPKPKSKAAAVANIKENRQREIEKSKDRKTPSKAKRSADEYDPKIMGLLQLAVGEHD